MTIGGSAINEPKSALERALRWVGDLDHPFYNDERQRYVWYEASAIGFQLMFLANYAAAGLMLWIGGAEALPYGLAIFVVSIVVALAVMGYASRRRAEYAPDLSDVFRKRGVLGVVISAFAVSGFIRALIDAGDGVGGFTGGLAEGAIAGVVVGAPVGVYSLWKKSKELNEAEGQ